MAKFVDKKKDEKRQMFLDISALRKENEALQMHLMNVDKSQDRIAAIITFLLEWSNIKDTM